MQLLLRTMLVRADLQRIEASLPYLVVRLNRLDPAQLPKVDITTNELTGRRYTLAVRPPDSTATVTVVVADPDRPSRVQLTTNLPGPATGFTAGDGRLSLAADVPIRYEENVRRPLGSGHLAHRRAVVRLRAFVRSVGSNCQLDLELTGHLRGWLRPFGAVAGPLIRRQVSAGMDEAISRLSTEISRIANLAGPAATSDELATAMVAEFTKAMRPRPDEPHQ